MGALRQVPPEKKKRFCAKSCLDAQKRYKSSKKSLFFVMKIDLCFRAGCAIMEQYTWMFPTLFIV